jgi:valyl-tRNA synthetase
MVNDAHGKKMSKSKGNVINPLEMTDKYGTDALRLALTIGITPGNDGSLSESKVEGYRNFCNKLWNVARFILGQLPEDYSPTTPQLTSPADHWIMAKLNAAIADSTDAIENYRFSEAGQVPYSLLWDDFADWYIEASKVAPNHDLLVYGLETILKLTHPVAPYVTEAIWSHLPWQTTQLISTLWPKPNKQGTSTSDFEAVRTIVTATRTLASEEQLSKPTILTTDAQILEQSDLIVRLARAGAIKQVEQGSGLYLGTTIPAWIEADESVIQKRRHRLEDQQKEKQTYLKGLESKLSNEKYVQGAPEAVVRETRDRRDETLILLSKLDEQLKGLNT